MEGIPPPYRPSTEPPPLYSPPGVPSPARTPPAQDSSPFFPVKLAFEHRDITTNGKPGPLRSSHTSTINVADTWGSTHLFNNIRQALESAYSPRRLCPQRQFKLRASVAALDLNETGKHVELKNGAWTKMLLGLRRQADLNKIPVLKVKFGCGCKACTTTNPAAPKPQTTKTPQLTEEPYPMEGLTWRAQEDIRQQRARPEPPSALQLKVTADRAEKQARRDAAFASRGPEPNMFDSMRANYIKAKRDERFKKMLRRK